ncbi:MAG: transglutaminase-like cysteine peptidase [Sphingopyxis sp.]|nr:transglutaminase-like cysteine peptidase [Sphingopyxis sp.]
MTLVVAATLLPSAAHATSKISNEKRLVRDAVTCSIAAPTSRIDTTRIILGGAPSALDRIRADQQGVIPAAPSVGAAVPILAGTGGGLFSAGKPLEPASRTSISFQPPEPFDSPTGCAAGSLSTVDNSEAFSFGGDAQFAARDPAAELGTLAIPIKRTRFDARWERVRRPSATGVMHAQLANADARPGLDDAALLARVNQWVNGRIAYVNDDRNYRQSDFWATAEQTLGRGSGDCEDFAILKMQLLRAAGIDSDRMKLVLLRDLAANNDHAVLLVETAAGKLVLDNTTNLVYDGSRSNSVRPVLSFSGNRRWVHAYRNAEPSRNLLASVPASGKSFALALNDQRSVSAALLTFKTGFSK